MSILDSHLSSEKKRNILFLSASCSWAVCSSGPLCVREQRHGKVVFQQSCMKFNLLSQKAFNPFYAVILLNLVPKQGHLEEKKSLSPINTIKISFNSCSLVCEPPSPHTHTQKSKTVLMTKGFYFEWDHLERKNKTKQNMITALENIIPYLSTCLAVWWTGVDISGWICQTDLDKLWHCSHSHLHTFPSNLPIYWICKISHHPSACQHENCPAWAPPPSML